MSDFIMFTHKRNDLLLVTALNCVLWSLLCPTPAFTVCVYRPLIDRSSSIESSSGSVQINHFEDAEFTGLVCEAEDAILTGIPPQRISQGSSGSYFVRNVKSVRELLTPLVGRTRLCMCTWFQSMRCRVTLGH